MIEILVPERVLIELDGDLASLMKSTVQVFRVGPDDSESGVALRRHLLFSQWPSLLERASLHLTAEELLYNSYYWMRRLSRLHRRQHGYDAGIEQQVFKVLEDANCDVDWTTVEQIEAFVDREFDEA